MRESIRAATSPGRGTAPPNGQAQPPAPPPRWPTATALAIAGGLLLAGVVAGAGLSRAGCQNATEQRREVGELVSQGKAALAAGLAELQLTTQDMCPDARRELAELAYRATLSDVLSLHQSGGRDAGLSQAVVLRWQEAERKANARGVPRERRAPAMTVSRDAYTVGLWSLSRAAFLRAWEEGTVAAHDLQAVAHYYAVLRNWGLALVETPEPARRQEGLVALRTAREIAAAYRLPRGEAQQDLVRLVGENPSAWPAPELHDPVLAAAHP